jgi:hypothetical protein
VVPSRASATNSRCRWPPDRLPKLARRLPARPPFAQRPGLVDGRAGAGGQRGEQVHGLADGDPVGQRRVLELGADQPRHPVGLGLRVDAEHADASGVGDAQPVRALDGGGLA